MRTLDQLAAIGLRSVAAKCPECEAAFRSAAEGDRPASETGIEAIVTRLRPIACSHCSARLRKSFRRKISIRRSRRRSRHRQASPPGGTPMVIWLGTWTPS